MKRRMGDVEVEWDGAGVRRIEHAGIAGAAIWDPGVELAGTLAGRPVVVGRSHVVRTREDDGAIEIVHEAPRAARLVVRVAAAQLPGALSITGRIENLADTELFLDRLTLLHVAPPTGGLRLGADLLDCAMLKNGWQSWSATESLRLTERDFSPYLAFLRTSEENPAGPASGVPGDVRSEWVTCVQNLKTRQALLLGFVTAADQFTDVRLSVGVPGGALRELAATCRLDGVPLAPGESLTSEELLLAFGTDAPRLLSTWAEITGRRMKARVADRAPMGWCTWYYYYTKVREQDVTENLNAALRLRERLPFDVFQIDDGYQKAVGDWLRWNEKFPEGVGPLAERIRRAGMTPGIWTAPFVAGPGSMLHREHPDWFLRDARGRRVLAGLNPIWKGRFFALDPTHPGVEDYVRGVFREFVRLGFGFFKIDFIYAAALPGVRHDRRATRAQALRRGIQMIREEIGESFLLGCGSPLGPAVGLVDGMRIGPDVTPIWGSNLPRWILRDKNTLSTVNAIRNTATRGFMHRRLWWNDPDCLMSRIERTRLSREEVRTWASVVAASGGMVILSDDLAALGEESLDLVGKVLALRGAGFLPLDLMDHSFPELLAAPRPWGVLLAVINYSGHPVDRAVDLALLLADGDFSRIESLRDAWTGEALDHREGHLLLRQTPAHGTRLIEVKWRG